MSTYRDALAQCQKALEAFPQPGSKLGKEIDAEMRVQGGSTVPWVRAFMHFEKLRDEALIVAAAALAAGEQDAAGKALFAAADAIRNRKDHP